MPSRPRVSWSNSRRFAIKEKPDLVVVVGDVNSTMACTIVAAKLLIRWPTSKPGLRSFDRTMPEEINRLVTDALADLLFTTSRDADENLKRKASTPQKIHFVGNVMIDTLLKHREKAGDASGRSRSKYALVTLHRPSNVDDPIVLSRNSRSSRRNFEIDARHLSNSSTNGETRSTNSACRLEGIRTIDPLGYLEFLNLMSDATVVLTDSGGLQEETTILGVPCLTLRHNTERPVTIAQGTNIMVGPDKARILDAFRRITNGDWKPAGPPEFWDGHAAERIIRVIRDIRD